MTCNGNNCWISCQLIGDCCSTFGGTLGILSNQFKGKAFNSSGILYSNGCTLGNIHTE